MKFKCNPRERKVQKEYLDKGYEVLTKGWPDFLMVKDGKVKLIEVKRKQKRKTAKMGLSKHQRRVIEVLRSAGLNVEVRYIK